MPTIGLKKMATYNTKKPAEGWLYRETMTLLVNRPKPVRLEDVAEKAGVSIGWLKFFIAGRIADPSANRLEAIYNLLADKPLGE